MEEYKGKVRVVWRDLPLPFHPNAMPAAIAARAAGEQGKFWEMHDKLFANQQQLDRADLEKYAQELGLNMGKFKAALDSAQGQGRRSRPTRPRAARSAPAARPRSSSTASSCRARSRSRRSRPKIDEELKIAEALVAKGTPKAKVYEALMKDAKSEVPAAPAAAPARRGQGPRGGHQGLRGRRPVTRPSKGPKNAPLQVIVFSDFQCPFCRRVEPTLAQMEKEYAGKVRVVWKNYPLPFHNNAEPAAEAAMAAHAQGKFWEMHDKLFENSSALERADLEKYAAGPRPRHGQVQGRPRRGEVQGRRSRPRPRKARRWA